jgi:hypothetical protein
VKGELLMFSFYPHVDDSLLSLVIALMDLRKGAPRMVDVC